MFDIASGDLKNKYWNQTTDKTLKFIRITRAFSSSTQVSQHAMRERKLQSNEIVKCKHFVGNTLTTFPEHPPPGIIACRHFILFSPLLKSNRKLGKCYAITRIKQPNSLFAEWVVYRFTSDSVFCFVCREKKSAMDGYGFGVDFLFVFQIKIRDDEIKATSNGEKKTSGTNMWNIHVIKTNFNLNI